MLTRLSIALLTTAALSSACIPPEDPQGIPTFDPTTHLGQIQRADTLVVGIEDLAPLVSRDSSGEAEGFAVEHARWIADALGVELEVRTAPSSAALITLLERGVIDVAFPTAPITEELLRNNVVTDPYLISNQRLLVPEDSSAADVSDLAGDTVCWTVDPDTGVALDDIEATIQIIRASTARECARVLGSGEAQAATGLDLLLVAIIEKLQASGSCPQPFSCSAKIVGPDIATAGIGALVQQTQPSYRDFVNEVFADARADGRWLDAFRLHIGPYLPAPPTPPGLSAEEAAALYPTPT
ncbi:MAG: substrate-binding periplasmic protein [Actinomycetota bacterium]